MNTITKMSTLPYLPTELWNKIYDYKEAMEARDAQVLHKNAMYETFRFIKSVVKVSGGRFMDECTCECCEVRCWEVDKDSGFMYGDMIATSYGTECPDCIDREWEEAKYFYEGWFDGGGYDRFLDDLESGEKGDVLEAMMEGKFEYTFYR